MRPLMFALVMGVMCSSSLAIPRYSAQYNQSCVLCHVNPSGAGARALYGTQFFAYTELATKPTKFEDVGKIQPMLNDQVQIGFDARTMYSGTDDPSTNSFMQMQGDLYVIFQLSDQWTFYLDKGLYAGFEIWGMGHFLPYNGYLKVGRFTPPYGLRLADHKTFVRDKLGMAYGWYESGMEIGFHPQHFTFALAATNGSTQFTDADEAKAVTGRADLRIPVSNLLLWIGATGRYNEIAGNEDWIGGGYGGLSFDRFTLLGEVDYRKYINQESLVSFAELSCKVYRGVTLKAEYDFFDPDLDYQSGADHMVVAGAEFVPLGFLQIIPNVRYYDLASAGDHQYYEGEIQLHLFF